jgi:hypothetical protein
MTNQEILEKAIQKAGNNGWIGKVLYENTGHSTWEEFVEEYIDSLLEQRTYMALMTEHHFAKALWGESSRMHRYRESPKVSDAYGAAAKYFNLRQADWQYHLQQMVIAEDPIKYLGENT